MSRTKKSHIRANTMHCAPCCLGAILLVLLVSAGCSADLCLDRHIKAALQGHTSIITTAKPFYKSTRRADDQCPRDIASAYTHMLCAYHKSGTNGMSITSKLMAYLSSAKVLRIALGGIRHCRDLVSGLGKNSLPPIVMFVRRPSDLISSALYYHMTTPPSTDPLWTNKKVPGTDQSYQQFYRTHSISDSIPVVFDQMLPQVTAMLADLTWLQNNRHLFAKIFIVRNHEMHHDDIFREMASAVFNLSEKDIDRYIAYIHDQDAMVRDGIKQRRMLAGHVDQTHDKVSHKETTILNLFQYDRPSVSCPSIAAFTTDADVLYENLVGQLSQQNR